MPVAVGRIQMLELTGLNGLRKPMSRDIVNIVNQSIITEGVEL
jgi:hypothetical protein